MGKGRRGDRVFKTPSPYNNLAAVCAVCAHSEPACLPPLSSVLKRRIGQGRLRPAFLC